jgi:hypothetical protein
MPPIATAVWINVDDTETDPQPIAAECPECFAIVRGRHLGDHRVAVHYQTSQDDTE